MRLKIFAIRYNFNTNEKEYLNYILKNLCDDGCERINNRKYNLYNGLFLIVDQPDEADIYLIPLRWNYYINKDNKLFVFDEVLKASQMVKRIIIFSDGDFTAKISVPGLILFEKSSYRSRKTSDNIVRHSLPVFIPDYVKLYCLENLQLRQKGEKPIVGFCGQAGGTFLDFGKRNIVNLYRKLAFRAGLRQWEPPPFETTIFRHRILRAISKNLNIQSNFIIRNRYRAGYLPKKKDPFHPTRLEFVKNILDSDYTLCMRGVGNFSVRFYETLSLGRIPVFIDTDCRLPFDDLIDYRQYCVWINPEEVPFVAEKILDFHNSIKASDFIELQMECRKLWLERLSEDGFFRHFHEHFNLD